MANLINLNNTTPAPAANGQNVLWQSDASSPTNVSAYIALASVTTNVLINLSGAIYGDGNFTYTPSGTPTVAIIGNFTETGSMTITGAASAGTNPLSVVSSNNGPTNVSGSVLAMTNSGGSTTTAYIVKSTDNSLIIRNDGASIAVKGVLGFLSDGTVELLAGTQGASFVMNTNAGTFPAGSVSWQLPLTGVGTARFNIGTGTSIAWNWDAGTGNTLNTLTYGETYAIASNSELLTLSTGGTTTDTTGNLLPANAIILSVVVRVTTTISGGSTPTTWEAGDATTPARFISTGNALTATTTAVGLNQMQGGVSTNAAGPVQSSAAKVRITLDQTPGQGAVRITVFYIGFAAPTS